MRPCPTLAIATEEVIVITVIRVISQMKIRNVPLLEEFSSFQGLPLSSNKPPKPIK